MFLIRRFRRSAAKSALPDTFGAKVPKTLGVASLRNESHLIISLEPAELATLKQSSVRSELLRLGSLGVADTPRPPIENDD